MLTRPYYHHFLQEQRRLQSAIMIPAIVFLISLSIGIVFAAQRIATRGWSYVWKATLFSRSIPPQRRSSLGYTETHIRQDVKPYQFPPIRERTSTKMAMGLKRLDESNWLTLDSNYLAEHILRCNLLNSNHKNVIESLPGSEFACHEVLEIVTEFLANRFPQHFTLANTSSGPTIQNHLTDETFFIGKSCPNPLEIAAKLSMEDFNILLKNPNTGEYHLQASATLFPAGWKLQERIGTSMANLHKPVPSWKEKLGGSVNRYFDHLSPKTAMERTNLFIQTTPHLFQDAPEATPSHALTVKDLVVRRERQTFTRLEKSGAVLFTVRTYMSPMTELGVAETKALKSQVMGWEEEIRNYKGVAIWGPKLMEWCDEVAAREDSIEKS